ncbi:MAG: hypothetical protein VB912_11655 [Pirellulaceae bacterium]
MNRLVSHRIGRMTVALLAVFAVQVRADNDLEKRASWSAPTGVNVKAQVEQWLQTQTVDELTQLKITALWPTDGLPTEPAQLLSQATATMALLSPTAHKLVVHCDSDSHSLVLPEFKVLEEKSLSPWARSNLRLLYARWLVQQRLYDEALEQVKDIKPEEVIDPAALLFYQSACYHRLLKKEQCLTLISKLMENKDTIPTRYQTLARLMEADLKPLKTDSLDEIARLMGDIQRRLDLARAGKRVRTEEDDVIAKLDKMIEELEQQQQQQSGGGAGPGGNNPSSPAPDSVPLGGSGPGNVDPKSIGNASGWGNLPPKEREKALQQISKGLPAHYREVIEEYFRKLARDGSN